jgi:ATP-dependent DNA helicase RecG
METKSPLQYLKGVGPQRAKILAKLGIGTEEDLLYHLPRRYEDRSNLKTLSQLRAGETETTIAYIRRIEELKPRKGLLITKVHLQDKTGTAIGLWYNQSYLIKHLSLGAQVIITGKVDYRFGQKEIAVNEYELVSGKASLHIGRIVPFYPSSEGLNQRFWREVQYQALSRNAESFREIFSAEELKELELLPVLEALREIHFPSSFTQLEKARYRLVFEEFYLLQLALLVLRGNSQKSAKGIAHQKENKLPERFVQNLPFPLTEAQRRVITEINSDMESSAPMQRLVQGDVGSGKTVIAAWGLLKAVEGGYQGALMAPTEILAQQHYNTLAGWFGPLEVKIALLKGSLSRREKDLIIDRVMRREIDILVGTHALIQEGVEFASLGLVVIDEQHRFGVKQRSLLEEKGQQPDVLVMSATPIPRTLALTVYGDLDISLLDELPPGRKPVETYCIREQSRGKLKKFLAKQLSLGSQAYIVCPLVEESEALDIKNATTLAEKIKREFPFYKIGLLHGRMNAKEKEKIMQDFQAGRLHILVSTTVIEVGVNVPNATVMVIEDAERFGLAQLHQLRGRVGRGKDQSYCILISSSQNPVALERLRILSKNQDGFKLAEEDLKLRGPGEFFGMRQHGLPEFKVGDLARDGEILLRARRMALKVLQRDPHLGDFSHKNLHEKVWALIKKMVKY